MIVEYIQIIEENLIEVVKYCIDNNIAELKISIDGTWSARGRTATHGSLRVVAHKSCCPDHLKNETVLIYRHVISKPRLITKTKKDGTKYEVNISKGDHQGSSSSMEHVMTEGMLEHLSQTFQKLGATTLKLSICIDGDVGLYNLLSSHALVSQVFRDLAHILKNITKNIIKQLGQGETATIHANRIKSWLVQILSISWDLNLPNDQARLLFLNYTQHHSNNHTNCLENSPCKKEGWKQDESTKLQDKPALRAQMQDIVATAWPEGAKLVTDQRTSQCESANSQATSYHDKRKDFPASWKVRDGIANANSQVTYEYIYVYICCGYLVQSCPSTSTILHPLTTIMFGL